MDKNYIYLDNLTITPVMDKAIDTMLEAARGGYGHIRSTNEPGRKAQEFLHSAERTVADYFGGGCTRFYYDGGVANALVLLSAAKIQKKKGKSHIVASPIEHTSIVMALRMLKRDGFSISFTSLDKTHRVTPEMLSDKVRADTGIVTIGLASDESGVIQPIEDLSEVIRNKEILFHCDARSAAGRLPIDIHRYGIDILTLASHKFGGPFAVGAAVALSDNPAIFNSSPEFSGALNIPGIAGLMATLKELNTGLKPRTRMLNNLRDEVISGLKEWNSDISIIGEKSKNLLPGVALIEFSEITSEKLHIKLENAKIIVPSYNSSARIAYLRGTGLDFGNPDRYLGFAFAPDNTLVDAEILIRTVSEFTGGYANEML